MATTSSLLSISPSTGPLPFSAVPPAWAQGGITWAQGSRHVSATGPVLNSSGQVLPISTESFARAPTVPAATESSIQSVIETTKTVEKKGHHKVAFFVPCMGGNRQQSSLQAFGVERMVSASTSSVSISGSSKTSTTYTTSNSLGSSETPQEQKRVQLPIPKNQNIDESKTTASSDEWDFSSRYMKAVRTGPTSWPPHIHTKNPEFSKTGPSPLMLYYYDETAPNNVLLSNDVRGEHPAQQLKNLLTCQGGKQAEYPIDGDEYSTHVPALAKSMSHHLSDGTTSEGSEDSPYERSTSNSSDEKPKRAHNIPKANSGCCGNNRQESVPTQISSSYSSSSHPTASLKSSSYTSSHDAGQRPAMRSVSRPSMRSASRPAVGSHHQNGSVQRSASGPRSYSELRKQSDVTLAPRNGCCGQANNRARAMDRLESNPVSSEIVSKFSKQNNPNKYIVNAPPAPLSLPGAYTTRSTATSLPPRHPTATISPRPQKNGQYRSRTMTTVIPRAVTGATELVSEYQVVDPQRHISMQVGSADNKLSAPIYSNLPVQSTYQCIPATQNPATNETLSQGNHMRGTTQETVLQTPRSLVLQPGSRRCLECNGTGIVYDAKAKTKRGTCGCSRAAPSVSAYPASQHTAKDRAMSNMESAPHVGQHSQASIPKPKAGCCAHESSSVSSYTCTSCSCSECSAGRKETGNGRTQSTMDIPSEMRAHSHHPVDEMGRKASDVVSSVPSSTSSHHYKETEKPEKDRDLGYAIRKLFFNVDESPKPGDSAADQDYKMCPTYSVSYQNYPDICYDAIIPSNYRDFFRTRVPPVGQ